VKATRILPLVLICIVALGAASTISFALWSNAVPWIGIEAPQGNFDANWLAKAVARNTRPLGDPVDNPKPN